MNRIALAVLVGLASVAAIATLVRARETATTDEAVPAITLPERTSAEPPAPPSIPEVPASADTLVPVSYELVTTVEGGSTASAPSTRQRVTRTADRAHLSLAGGRREWLFVRNPVYRDRVSGYLIDHDARQVRFHDETDLRLAVQVRGWADVLMMKFDRASLETLTRTADTTTAAGAEFHRYTAGADSASGLVEVWWNESLLLPLSLAVRTSESVTMRSRVEKLAFGIDESLLRDPAVRFPEYEQLDINDPKDHHS